MGGVARNYNAGRGLEAPAAQGALEGRNEPYCSLYSQGLAGLDAVGGQGVEGAEQGEGDLFQAPFCLHEWEKERKEACSLTVHPLPTAALPPSLPGTRPRGACGCPNSNPHTLPSVMPATRGQVQPATNRAGVKAHPPPRRPSLFTHLVHSEPRTPSGARLGFYRGWGDGGWGEPVGLGGIVQAAETTYLGRPHREVR